MSELLGGLENVLPYVKLAAVVIGVVLLLIAAAALTYIVKTTFRPLYMVTQWMIGYAPGEKPGDVVRGIGYGARMLAWAALIGLVVWFYFH